MAVTLNGAGSSTLDPILNGLTEEIIIGANTFDVASVSDVWIENTSIIPGTAGSIKSNLSPAASTLTVGLASGTYNDTNKQYSITSTTGLTVGDYLYLEQAALPGGLYKIASIVNATNFTLVTNPLNGLGNKTGISYQVAWKYNATNGTAPISIGLNYLKARLFDGANNGDLAESFYVQNPPSGSAFVSIGGKNYTGETIATLVPSFDLLPGWANKGGVSQVELTNHSSQNVNHFKWGDNTTAEKNIAAALTGGFNLTPGDGMKYGRLLLKSASGGNSIGVDLAITLDTTGPGVVFLVRGS
jgi:hypothetical protein